MLSAHDGRAHTHIHTHAENCLSYCIASAPANLHASVVFARWPNFLTYHYDGAICKLCVCDFKDMYQHEEFFQAECEVWPEYKRKTTIC